MMKNLMIFNVKLKQEIKDDPFEQANWRQTSLTYIHLIAGGCLLIECLINRLRIKLNHYWFTMLFVIFYFLITIVYEWNSRRPCLIENLNWFCKQNNSFIFKKDDEGNRIIQSAHIQNTTCDYIPEQVSSFYDCQEFAQSYYCPVD